jgi:spore germination cell wall hydrolase CwlJ-like protein
VRLSQAQKSVVWVLLVVLMLGAAALALTMIAQEGPGVTRTMDGTIDGRAGSALSADAQDADPSADLPIERFLPSEVLKLDAQDAMARNLALPVSTGPNPVAPIFVAQWLGPELASATKCLATAVYYEAAGEPIAGQRAVAQVVLNRLRNPRYPKTICDVVYQGAERPTGCQFSFACDGSTRRVPGAAGLAVATAVATSVLNGVTSAEVGQATHYHTLAVFPAWAPQLAKIGIIGHHVFYRPPGRITYSYDVIPKVPPLEPLPAAVADVAPLPDPVRLPSKPSNASAATVASDAASAGGSPISGQAGLDAVRAGDLRQSGGSANDQSAAVAPVDKSPRSMFPVRRNRTPNLPLVSGQ